MACGKKTAPAKGGKTVKAKSGKTVKATCGGKCGGKKAKK